VSQCLIIAESNYDKVFKRKNLFVCDLIPKKQIIIKSEETATTTTTTNSSEEKLNQEFEIKDGNEHKRLVE
jgi:hypothetical protein